MDITLLKAPNYKNIKDTIQTGPIQQQNQGGNIDYNCFQTKFDCSRITHDSPFDFSH